MNGSTQRHVNSRTWPGAPRPHLSFPHGPNAGVLCDICKRPRGNSAFRRIAQIAAWPSGGTSTPINSRSCPEKARNPHLRIFSSFKRHNQHQSPRPAVPQRRLPAASRRPPHKLRSWAPPGAAWTRPRAHLANVCQFSPTESLRDPFGVTVQSLNHIRGVGRFGLGCGSVPLWGRGNVLEPVSLLPRLSGVLPEPSTTDLSYLPTWVVTAVTVREFDTTWILEPLYFRYLCRCFGTAPSVGPQPG